MSLALEIEPGGEYLLPFAKRQLTLLRAKLDKQQGNQLTKNIMVDDGTAIFLQCVRGFADQTQDIIRIKSTTGWVAKETTPAVTTPQVYTLRTTTNSTVEAANRNLEPDDYYFNGTRYTASVVTGPIEGIPDSGPILAIYNNKTKTYIWTQFTLTDSEAFALTVKYVDFTFVTDDNLWAVVYLRRGSSFKTRKVVTLDLSGNTSTVDYAALGLIDISGSLFRLIPPSLAPVGILNNRPYFFVDGTDSVDSVTYKALLVSSLGTQTILTLPFDPSGTRDYSGYADRPCGGKVTSSTGATSLEIIFLVAKNDTSQGIPLSGSLYGFSTASGLVTIETFAYSTSTGGTTVIIPALNLGAGGGPSFAAAARTGSFIADRKTEACVVDTHIHAPVYRFVGIGPNTTPGIASYGSVTIVGYNPLATFTERSLDAPTVYGGSFGGAFNTNSFRGFVFQNNELSTNSERYRCVDTNGNVKLESLVPTNAGFVSTLFSFHTRRQKLVEKNDVVIFDELRYVLPDLAAVRVERRLLRLASGTTTTISAYQYPGTSLSARAALLDGLVVGGKAYCYALAEDTPGTEAKSHLRLITNNPGSATTYLVLLDSTGAIVNTIQEGISAAFTLDATELSLSAHKRLLDSWNGA